METKSCFTTLKTSPESHPSKHRFFVLRPDAVFFSFQTTLAIFLAPRSLSADDDDSDVVPLDSRERTMYVQYRINIYIQRFLTYNHFPLMDPTPPSTEVLEDFQSTQPLDEDEDAQPPLGDNVWAFLQPLNRSMVPIELNKSVVLFGRLKATPPNADDQACQVVKLAGLVIS